MTAVLSSLSTRPRTVTSRHPTLPQWALYSQTPSPAATQPGLMARDLAGTESSSGLPKTSRTCMTWYRRSYRYL